MKIIFYEMKKIWSIRLLLVVALICALYYSMFMEFDIDYFPNGHPQTEEVDYSIEMTKLYGPTLEENEYSEFMLRTREELISEAETYIKGNPVFSEVGIYTYGDYEKADEKREQTEAEHTAIWTLLGEECGFVQFKLQALDSIEERYSNYPNYTLEKFISEATGEKELARLTEIRETEEYRNIMDRWVFDNTVEYAVRLAILSVLAVLALVSPLIVTDRARNLHLLQYTAKHGRRIFNKQLTAVILSAFLLTTVLLLIFGAVYSTNGTRPFWNNGLTSFFNLGTAFWFDITYGQYIIIYIVLLYVLCLSTAAVAFVLSRFSQNLIALILKLIPLFAVLGALCFSVFYGTFSYDGNILYMITGIIGIEPVVCILVLTAASAVSFFIVHREKKVDVI